MLPAGTVLDRKALNAAGISSDDVESVFGSDLFGGKAPAAPAGGKAPAAPAAPAAPTAPAAPAGGKTSSSSSGSSSGGSKSFFNDKSLKYGLTGAGIGGAVGYAMGDKRRSGITEEVDVDPDDEQLEESLKDYIKNNATLFLG